VSCRRFGEDETAISVLGALAAPAAMNYVTAFFDVNLLGQNVK
jgi:hypothetical protein